MCGLVGVVGGNLTVKDKDVFKTLLVLDIFRGPHSTGVATFDHQTNEAKVIKAKGDPFTAVFSKPEFHDQVNSNTLNMLMGHNRFATVGEINDENAHPYEIGNVVGAHNGTLRKVELLEDGDKFPVDSMALLNHIDKHGAEDAIKNTDGAFCLTWFDKQTEDFNLVRNAERPMHYAIVGNTLYYASEEWMLSKAFGINKVNNSAKIKSLDTHKLLTFNIGSGVKNLMSVAKVNPYVAPPRYQHNNYYRAGQRWDPQKGRYVDDPPKTYPPVNQKSQGDSFAGLVGSSINFRCDGVQVKDSNGVFYWDCYAVGDPRYANRDVRVYSGENLRVYETMQDNPYEKFKGEVKKVGIDELTNEPYILIKVPSVKLVIWGGEKRDDIPLLEGPDQENASEIFEDTGPTPLFVPVYGGSFVDRREFVRLTTAGCSGCGDPLYPEEADEYQWLASDVVFCKACVDNGICQSYKDNDL